MRFRLLLVALMLIVSTVSCKPIIDPKPIITSTPSAELQKAIDTAESALATQIHFLRTTQTP